MQDVQTQLQITYDLTCSIDPSTPQCVSMALSIRQLRDTRALMLERTGRIRALYNNLETISQESAQLHEKLVTTDVKLQNMQESISNYTSEISNINGNITSIETAINSLEMLKTSLRMSQTRWRNSHPR